MQKPISIQLLSCHQSPFSSVSHGRLADSGKRGLLNTQFELKKLIIDRESGGGERERDTPSLYSPSNPVPSLTQQLKPSSYLLSSVISSGFMNHGTILSNEKPAPPQHTQQVCVEPCFFGSHHSGIKYHMTL